MSGLALKSAQAALLLRHVVRSLSITYLRWFPGTCWVVPGLRALGVRDFCKNWGISKTVSETFVSQHHAPTAAIWSSVHTTELMGRLNVEPPNAVFSGLQDWEGR